MKLVKYDAARKALTEATRIDDVKSIRDKAVAMSVYAKQAKDSELIALSTEIRKRATRRLGQLMEEKREAGELAKPPGGSKKRPKKDRVVKKPDLSLTSQGIDKNLADAARKAAAMSEDKFEAQITQAVKVAVAATENDAAVVKAARKEQQDKKRACRTEREAKLATKIIALPDIKAGVIVADPEWKDEVWSEETGMDRHASNHYPTSAADAIAARDVGSIAAKDCVLFLWTTNQHLRIAITVMEAWGFEYKSNYCWGKDKISTGRWNRSKHELLLIGTHGKVPCPAPGTQWESLIVVPKGKHSEKPECFLEMIEGYFPNIPKIELNRRGPARPGWTAWGNEVVEAAE